MSLTSRLVRRGFRRGVLEGSRPWLVVGLVAGAVTLIRRITAEQPETVFRHAIEPGETLLIRAQAQEGEPVA